MQGVSSGRTDNWIRLETVEPSAFQNWVDRVILKVKATLVDDLTRTAACVT